MSLSRLLDRVDRRAERDAGRDVEGDGGRPGTGRGGRPAAARRLIDMWRWPTAAPGRRCRRWTADRSESSDSASSAASRIGLQDHAVLVRLGEDGRDDALAEGVVERVVDRRRRDAEARGRVAVDGHDERRQAAVLHVGRDVGELGQSAAAARRASAPRSSSSRRIGVLQRRTGTASRLTVASMVRSCTGCMIERDARHALAARV